MGFCGSLVLLVQPSGKGECLGESRGLVTISFRVRPPNSLLPCIGPRDYSLKPHWSAFVEGSGTPTKTER